ncbi:putative leader peptide [Actinomadura flavalba]
MNLSELLTARRHVDLRRQASALCPRRRSRP